MHKRRTKRKVSLTNSLLIGYRSPDGTIYQCFCWPSSLEPFSYYQSKSHSSYLASSACASRSHKWRCLAKNVPPTESAYGSSPGQTQTLSAQCIYRHRVCCCSTQRLQSTENPNGSYIGPTVVFRGTRGASCLLPLSTKGNIKDSFVHSPIDLSFNLSFHQIIQKIISNKVDCVATERFKIKHTQAAEKALKICWQPATTPQLTVSNMRTIVSLRIIS